MAALGAAFVGFIEVRLGLAALGTGFVGFIEMQCLRLLAVAARLMIRV